MSSSRRTSGEIHILAMLDGKTTGPLSPRFLALPATFWYGVAGVGVCVLLAALAWLAHTPAPAPDRGIEAGSAAVRMARTTDQAPEAPSPRVTDDSAVLVVTTLPHIDTPAPAAGATIVDVPAPATAAGPTGSTAPTASQAARIPAPRAPAATAAPGRSAAPHGASVATLATRDGAPVPARATLHPAAAKLPPGRLAQHRTGAAHAAASARADTTAPRARRPAGTPKVAQPTAVDTDVALISAIIQHTGIQPDSTDAAASPCRNHACGPRMPNRQ